MKQTHPVTIMTVAAEAGVSMKTVSRVLNNEAHVRSGTRERVMAAVRALGYKPNAAARTLAGSRSYLIALIYDNPAQGYVVRLQEGAMRACQASGYGLLPYHFTRRDLIEPTAFRSRLETGGVDGVIVTAPLSEQAEFVSFVEGTGVPHVLVGAGRKGHAARLIGIDDRAAAAALTRHLIGLGHRKFAIVGGPPEHEASIKREKGIRSALMESGLTLRDDWARAGDFTYRSGLEAGEALLCTSEHPQAIMALNDDMAAGVIAAAHKHGVAIPEALSVTGFDDSAFASLIFPTLTTVRQPLARIAETAVDTLISRDGETGDGKECLLDFELVFRASTGAPA